MEKERLTFNEIVKNVRSDLKQIANLYGIFKQKVETDLIEAKDFFYDVFADKIYETNVKIKKILKDMEISHGYLDGNVEKIIEAGSDVFRLGVHKKFVSELEYTLTHYMLNVEDCFSDARKYQHDTGWEKIKKVKPIDYLVEKRKRFISAREELSLAKDAIDKEDWPDVITHLRSAIDLAIKEKFGFKKIHPMLQFLNNADKYDLPLPSYYLIYSFFDMGSKRLHSGVINTPFEAKEALRVVTNFVDQLDLIEIDQKIIDDFKKKCKFVE